MWRPLVLLCFASILASAHHSYEATYFMDRQQQIEGDVLQFLLRNPHSFLHVQTTGDNGELTTWAVEWDPGRSKLQRQGVDTLKPGDHVILTGHPGRKTSDHRLVIMAITRPSDGWKWELPTRKKK